MDDAEGEHADGDPLVVTLTGPRRVEVLRALPNAAATLRAAEAGRG